MDHAFSGSGPGAQTRDGCSVELYRRLPYLGEIDALLPLLAPGGSVLELGCGAGRITRVLLDLGLRVTAVDNSPEMLSQVPERATRVLADIERLHLPQCFDTVLLPSCLINHPSPPVRRAFLHTSRRHMGPTSQLLIEHHDPRWLNHVQLGTLSSTPGITISVVAVAKDQETTRMTLRYDADGESWLHSFSAVALSDEAIRSLLAGEALHCAGSIEPPGRWVRALVSKSA